MKGNYDMYAHVAELTQITPLDQLMKKGKEFHADAMLSFLPGWLTLGFIWSSFKKKNLNRITQYGWQKTVLQ